MSRVAKQLTLDPSDRECLQSIAQSGKSEHRLVVRSQIILRCAESKPVIEEIAAALHVSIPTVIKWRNRYEEKGLLGIYDAPRSGRSDQYTAEDEKRILEKLNTTPPDGLSRWDGHVLARELHLPPGYVWRILRKNNIQLARLRSWCVSTDPDFAAKAADIIGLYLNPPNNALVISVDEKPSVQALSRRTGYVETSDKAVVRAVKSTYRRNGTINLFAALEISTGLIHGEITKHKRSWDFLEFMGRLLPEPHVGSETTIHVIMDNYCIHKHCDDWLSRHPNVVFHYTPTSASWLNMVEIWFNIMSRKVLRGAGFDSTHELGQAIHKFIQAYDEPGEHHPFIWRKRDVKGSQIRDTLTNLRN